jgi:hypothetical protein
LRQNSGGIGEMRHTMNNQTAGTWIPQIESAHSVAELVKLLRDYLGSLSAEDRSRLPAACEPHALSRATEIQEWAVILAQQDLKATGSGRGHALRQAANVFAAAAARLPRIAE